MGYFSDMDQAYGDDELRKTKRIFKLWLEGARKGNQGDVRIEWQEALGYRPEHFRSGDLCIDYKELDHCDIMGWYAVSDLN